MRLRVISGVVLLLTSGLAGCTVPHRGELGISVDAQGRVIGVIAACPDQHVQSLELLDQTQRGVQVTLKPTGDDRPDSIVLSDPGDGWTDDWPERPTYGEDPRKLTADHEYAFNGRTAGTGFFASDSILFGVSFVPEKVLENNQLRSGMVLTWNERIVPADKFRSDDHAC